LVVGAPAFAAALADGVKPATPTGQWQMRAFTISVSLYGMLTVTV
jgi:hypothetical protein